MARYVVHVHTSMAPPEAFAFMSDLTNFAEWDPGVIRSVQVLGQHSEKGAAFDVTVKGFPRPIVLRYHLTICDPPNALVARAESRLLTSHDRITVKAVEAGSIVTYDAELTLNGPFGLVDRLVGIAFGRIGDRAADGLIRALGGERVDAAAT